MEGPNQSDHPTDRHPGRPTEPAAPLVSSGPTAAEVVWGYVAKQAGVLFAYEPEVRVDGPDSVHKSRVAARRTRSALKVYRAAVDAGAARGVARELRWYGEALGAPRDAEVLRDYLLERIADLDEGDLEGPVVDRLTASLNAEHARAHARLVEAMNTKRHDALMTELADVAAARPASPEGEAAAGVLLPGLLADAIARVDGLRAHAEEAPEHLEGWHDVRKAAKAVRYCAEALVDAFGEPAAEIASAWEAVTEAFGEVQDTVVSAEVLGRHAWAAELAGEPVRPYTLLVEGELDRRLVALRRGVEALDYALEMGAKLPDVTAARSAGASST